MERNGDWRVTFTGKRFWPLDPRPEDICIEDIAHQLSMICRYGGATSRFYSVAEHSVFVALNTPLKHRLAALMHDSAEAYVGDVVRPLKYLPTFAAYREVEANIERVIAAKYGFDLPLADCIKQADARITHDEREIFLEPQVWTPEEEARWGVVGEPLGVQLRGWDPANAEAAFLHVFYTLGHETAGRA